MSCRHFVFQVFVSNGKLRQAFPCIPEFPVRVVRERGVRAGGILAEAIDHSAHRFGVDSGRAKGWPLVSGDPSVDVADQLRAALIDVVGLFVARAESLFV